MLSLPSADYWLAPRRRALALAKVKLQLLTLAILVQLVASFSRPTGTEAALDEPDSVI